MATPSSPPTIEINAATRSIQLSYYIPYSIRSSGSGFTAPVTGQLYPIFYLFLFLYFISIKL